MRRSINCVIDGVTIWGPNENHFGTLVMKKKLLEEPSASKGGAAAQLKETEIKGTDNSGCEAEPLSCSHYVNKPTL